MNIMIHGEFLLKCKYKKGLGRIGADMKFEGGNIFSIDFVSQIKLLEWIDKLLEDEDSNVKLFSRLPPRRLLEHIDISRLELYWLTERSADYSLPPNLERLKRIFIEVTDLEEFLILDGFEWLIELHGNDKILNFVNDLSDLLHGTNTRVILPINTLSFENSWLSKFRKVIKHVNIELENNEIESFKEEENTEKTLNNDDERIEFDLGIDGSPRLSLLSRLPKIGFTNSILVKRILQWRRMGLDVSELEPALNYDIDDSYALYTIIEEKVRRVVELENYLYQNKEKIDVKEFTTSLFRIKQLTGIEELEKKFYTN